MEPQIGDTAFGWIEADGARYRHDIVIELDGTVRKRKKKLSKAVYGTSHRLSLDEAHDLFSEGCEALLIGSGQFGRVALSDEAEAFFASRAVRVEVLPTPDAARRWNELSGRIVGLFHITC
jgi:hypothetical protein